MRAPLSTRQPFKAFMFPNSLEVGFHPILQMETLKFRKVW